MNLIAQIFGLIALIIYCVSLQTTKREKLLKALIICNTFYCLQYLMLDAYAALFACLIGVVRTVIFFKYEKSNKPVKLWILLLIIGITIYSGILSYAGPISLIPIITGIMYSTAVWQQNLKIFRINCIINSLAWIFYNIQVGAYVSILSSITELISGSIAIIKLDIIKTKNKINKNES